jgi:glycine/D-amino acid oxidase-like deaminating enzyme
MSLPESTTYLVVGGGVHGLSTAWHLAMELEKSGKGSGKDVLLVDKSEPGAGATGVACGCVRNFYMTGAMHPILRHSLDVWNYDPVLLGFQQVGYVSCGEANQAEEFYNIQKSQASAGYPSVVYEGKDAHKFLTSVWPDFKHHSIGVVLHEIPSGYAGTAQAVRGLTELCQRHGVTIASGVEVLNYSTTNGTVTSVETNKGSIKCDLAILGLGAWTPNHWEMLGKPMSMDVRYLDGTEVKDKPTWTYWMLEEGESYFEPLYYSADCKNAPIIHIELMNTPVLDPKTGKELKDNVYVYWKDGSERMERRGLQGGTMPLRLGHEAEVEPYGHANDKYQATELFADYFSACLEMFMGRFKDMRPKFKERRNGGIGAFTPDNIPICDFIKDNVYMIADSNHGFKALGFGKLLAKELVTGRKTDELKPFSMKRFDEGRAFGSGVTNCPWV